MAQADMVWFEKQGHDPSCLGLRVVSGSIATQRSNGRPHWRINAQVVPVGGALAGTVHTIGGRRQIPRHRGAHDC